MIILNKPYVSDLLINTINNNQIEVLENDFLKENNLKVNRTISTERASIELNAKDYPLIYSNSENSIDWISKYLNQTELPQKINLFKDKVKFRELLKDLYPEFYFKQVTLEEINDLDVTNIPKPFVIKPSVGFFSLGVYIVNTNDDWQTIQAQLGHEIEKVKGMYPEAVMDASKFIIEQAIFGDEYAIDVYFNKNGEPVVCGIMKHLFASAEDTSDRVYFTSKEIIESKLDEFSQFANEIGKRANLKNFPMHMEVRVDANGTVNPIEINPMRFGGWSTTADLTTLAFKVNPISLYFKQEKPNWNETLKGTDGKKYSMIILDNSTGYSMEQIREFDHDKVKKAFSKVLDYRITNRHEYPVFAILFTESTAHDFQQVKDILSTDLKEFVQLKQFETQN